MENYLFENEVKEVLYVEIDFIKMRDSLKISNPQRGVLPVPAWVPAHYLKEDIYCLWRNDNYTLWVDYFMGVVEHMFSEILRVDKIQIASDDSTPEQAVGFTILYVVKNTTDGITRDNLNAYIGEFFNYLKDNSWLDNDYLSNEESWQTCEAWLRNTLLHTGLNATLPEKEEEVRHKL